MSKENRSVYFASGLGFVILVFIFWLSTLSFVDDRGGLIHIEKLKQVSLLKCVENEEWINSKCARDQ